MQIRNVECFCIEYADIARTETMCQSFEFWQNSWSWHIQSNRNKNFTEIHLIKLDVREFIVCI